MTQSGPMLDQKLPVSVIMLTLNEEVNLPGAIDSAKRWAGDIFIVDSCSTDRTVDIALENGVKIVQRPFTNFGDQWNFALDKLPITTEWTMKLDPDERCSPELVADLANQVTAPTRLVGYSVLRRLWFMGKPLRVYQPVLRVWKTGRCRFTDVLVNEHPIVDGPTGTLRGHLEHLDSPNLYHWWEKQNRYTTMEAISAVSGRRLAAEPRLFGSPLERRMLFKKYLHLVPLRYQLLWLNEVLVRGAWASGTTGLSWAHLRVEVMRMIELKTLEMRTTGVVPEMPRSPGAEYDPRVLASELQTSVMGRRAGSLGQDGQVRPTRAALSRTRSQRLAR